jgi:hypothetical protein
LFWAKETDLPALVTIISVPNSLNSSHRAFISRLALTPVNLAWSGFFISCSRSKEQGQFWFDFLLFWILLLSFREKEMPTYLD